MAESKSPLDASNTVSRLPPIPDKCHRFVLMRHGESAFNNANIFTGWCDVALTQRGVVEAVEAGEVFLSQSLHFRKCYVSLLSRSIVTAHRALDAGGIAYTPLDYDYRWNERHYGALQGLSKEQTAIRMGRDIVMKWRRCYSDRPPLMTEQHPHFQTINKDPRYRYLMHVPRGESLEDCQQRVVEVWKETIQEIEQNFEPLDFNYSLLVAHANTLRALVMHLDIIDPEGIESLNIPTAIPFYYDIDLSTGQVVSNKPQGMFRGIFITDERKQRSFLERRRAANDPWMWALHDDQVATSMLSDREQPEQANSEKFGTEEQLRVPELEEEARKNTELFAPDQSTRDP
ncbi:phosphoglyceromutase [Nitzschia inconspicua]|uniref:Phosphoglycerate mutase n=1 Tax=Nitzschia inconspicua TaxID=303405 RepID=A0A9K3M106_9STRA|nr:phosphoglyceromutase [Nitzschia inconspicua]